MIDFFSRSRTTNLDLESSLIATAVIDLYAADESNNRKTVLLLVQDGNMSTLRESFVAELSKRNINSDKPVFVILNCVRIAHINAERSDDVNLVDHLTGDEKKKFDAKKECLKRRYPDIFPTFHGFNIMKSDFSQDYVKRAWDACRPLVSNRGPQPIACLCLLNSYVPGSIFLKSCCDKFEETMRPFLHLTVSFNLNGSAEVLRMAHPMIAEHGTQVFHEAGVGRKVTAFTLLKSLCTEDHVLFLSEFIKKLLITRQEDDSGNYLFFSRLILDIKTGNAETGKKMCLEVLMEAFKIFPLIGSYPQTLSRFYYLEMTDYSKALQWAGKAKEIAPYNSFIADTLGQVYKHQLNRELKNELNPNTLTTIFYLAKNAFEAFEHAENLAENESTIFNVRPISSYLKVANNLFERKEDLEKATKRKKRKEYNELISPISDKKEKRARFINMLLSYSEKSFGDKDPEYVLREARQCYKDYIRDGDLKEGLGTGIREEDLKKLHKNWPNDKQKPRLKLKMMVEDLKASFHETQENYFRSRKLLPLLYLEKIDGVKERVDGEVRFHKLYTTVGDEEIELDVDPAQQLALWRSGTVTFELGFTIRGPTAYNIQFPNKRRQ
uniref:Uncharacterized protein n=1 Tax=Gadus morhua TaxID=8049 RepID=A0A8C5BDC1_GADMO